MAILDRAHYCVFEAGMVCHTCETLESWSHLHRHPEQRLGFWVFPTALTSPSPGLTVQVTRSKIQMRTVPTFTDSATAAIQMAVVHKRHVSPLEPLFRAPNLRSHEERTHGVDEGQQGCDSDLRRDLFLQGILRRCCQSCDCASRPAMGQMETLSMSISAPWAPCTPSTGECGGTFMATTVSPSV